MSKKGFTLIEMLIVIAIIAITLPVVFSIFVVSLQSQAKVFVLQNVKKNGDSALDVIEYLVKNKIYTIYSDSGLTNEVCTTRSNQGTDATYSSSSGNPLYFADKDGNSFYVDQVNDSGTTRIAYYYPDAHFLTTPLVAVQNFSISCSRSSFLSPPVIAISFTVSQLDSVTRHENTATLNYQTKIKLRSY
jgi:prepilin-type N-terminal cleavage/methylation domain-containing protein